MLKNYNNTPYEEIIKYSRTPRNKKQTFDILEIDIN